ncbi:MAG: hypothetical protein M0R02_11575, partial [Bacteroidales bacterium]|nr:hypothetical protein [Bacteroidales bacterium]
RSNKNVGANPCGCPNTNQHANNPPKTIMNNAGKMIEIQWVDLKNRFPNIELHEFVVMPNHFHGILEIVGNKQPQGIAKNNMGQPQGIAKNNMGQPQGIAKNNMGQPQGIAPTVGDIIAAFKSITTVEYIRGIKQHNWKPCNRKLWQRNYWEHIIRNEKSYYNISEYIINNPQKWKEDTLYEK